MRCSVRQPMTVSLLSVAAGERSASWLRKNQFFLCAQRKFGESHEYGSAVTLASERAVARKTHWRREAVARKKRKSKEKRPREGDEGKS